MLVYSAWKTPYKGKKFAIETLVAETPSKHEATVICEQVKKAGFEARVAGPHEPQDDDPSQIPLRY